MQHADINVALKKVASVFIIHDDFVSAQKVYEEIWFRELNQEECENIGNVEARTVSEDSESRESALDSRIRALYMLSLLKERCGDYDGAIEMLLKTPS